MKCFFLLIAGFACCCVSGCSTTGVGNEKALIIAAGQRYLKANSGPGVGEVKIVIEEVDDDYARLGVTPVLPTTDPATMYLHKNVETGRWEGITLGTGWSPGDFEDLRIPESIRD